MEPHHAWLGPSLSESLAGEQSVADKHPLPGHHAEDRFRKRPAGGIVDNIAARGDGGDSVRVMLRNRRDAHRLQPFSMHGGTVNAVHRFRPRLTRPLPQQNAAIRSCSRKQHPFSLSGVAGEHHLRRQRIDIGPRGQMHVNGVRYGDRILGRAINIALPGALPTQRQNAFTQQMTKRRGSLSNDTDALIPRNRR